MEVESRGRNETTLASLPIRSSSIEKRVRFVSRPNRDERRKRCDNGSSPDRKWLLWRSDVSVQVGVSIVAHLEKPSSRRFWRVCRLQIRKNVWLKRRSVPTHQAMK